MFSKRVKADEIPVKHIRIDGVQAMGISGFKWNSNFKIELQNSSMLIEDNN